MRTAGLRTSMTASDSFVSPYSVSLLNNSIKKQFMPAYTQVRMETIIYRIGITILSIWFGASGFLEITKNPLVWHKTIQMGYPPYFITALGFAKIAGVIALLIPQKTAWLKEWVFAAFFFDVIFAFISGYSVYSFGRMSELVKPAVAFVLLLITYIMFRKINPVLRVSLN
jgi:DoxX-like protein